jgi:hypothetical protein
LILPSDVPDSCAFDEDVAASLGPGLDDQTVDDDGFRHMAQDLDWEVVGFAEVHTRVVTDQVVLPTFLSAKRTHCNDLKRQLTPRLG